MNKPSTEFEKDQQDILFIAAFGNYVKVHYLNKRTLLLRNSLKSLELKLSNQVFIRVHNQFIINLLRVKDYTGNAQGLKLTFEHQIEPVPVSRKYIAVFKKQFSSIKNRDILFSKNDPGYFQDLEDDI